MKKSIALILVLAITATFALSACRQEQPEQNEDSSDTGTTANATVSPPKTDASIPEMTRSPKTAKVRFIPDAEPIPEDVDVEHPEPVEDENGYAPVVDTRPTYGWAPGVAQKRIPEGMPDIVGNALASIVDYSKMNFFIGVVDLLDPVNGYRHVDDSGAIHPSSMIKAWIAEYAYLQIQNGNGNLNDIIGGSSLDYHLHEMIQMSDNNSTANVISYFGRSNIDKWIRENYGYTRLYADLRGNYSEGKTNQSSVSDSIAWLERVWHNQNSQVYGTILNLIFNSRTRAKLPSALAHYPSVHVGSKTGSYIYYGAADHDMGIVIEYDDNGQILVAYAIAIYTFSPAYEPTFSLARSRLFLVTQSVHEQFRQYALLKRALQEQQEQIPQTEAPPAPETQAPVTTTTPTPTTQAPVTTTTPKATTEPPAIVTEPATPKQTTAPAANA